MLALLTPHENTECLRKNTAYNRRFLIGPQNSRSTTKKNHLERNTRRRSMCNGTTLCPRIFLSHVVVKYQSICDSRALKRHALLQQCSQMGGPKTLRRVLAFFPSRNTGYPSPAAESCRAVIHCTTTTAQARQARTKRLERDLRTIASLSADRFSPFTIYCVSRAIL